MKILYSNIQPLGLENGQETIEECIKRQIENADKIEIAVGYVSKASLEELDSLVDMYQISNICLNIGMYYVEGMPEGTYHTAIKCDNRWKEKNIGEVRMINTFKYHGKIYCFFKNNEVFSAVIGSANLGVLKLEANNRRQYESSILTEDAEECRELALLLERLKSPVCSANIQEIDVPIIREENTSLNSIESVEQIPQKEIELYKIHKTDISFTLPLKVPASAERHMDDGKHYTKSNLNVCYAAPRNLRKSRDWFETQLTVSKEITRMEGYPVKNIPFFVITDDGYWFKVHTTSDGNKQFSAVGNELIMGRWIKGRLAAAGLVTPINNTGIDTERTGMITKEMLAAYGCDKLVLTKTTQKAADEYGNELDVWFFSFEASE